MRGGRIIQLVSAWGAQMSHWIHVGINGYMRALTLNEKVLATKDRPYQVRCSYWILYSVPCRPCCRDEWNQWSCESSVPCEMAVFGVVLLPEWTDVKSHVTFRIESQLFINPDDHCAHKWQPWGCIVLNEFPLMTSESPSPSWTGLGSAQTLTPTQYWSVGSKGPVTTAVDELAAEEDTTAQDFNGSAAQSYRPI